MLLQRYVKVVLDDEKNPLIIESGAGLEFELPKIDDLKFDENYFEEKKYSLYENSHEELPNSNLIKTWYYSNWKLSNYMRGWHYRCGVSLISMNVGWIIYHRLKNRIDDYPF